MPGPKTYLTERLLMRALTEPVVIPFPSKKAAVNYRLRLYAFIRGALRNDETDADLKRILPHLEIQVRQGEVWEVLIQPEWLNEELQRIATITGIPVGPDYEFVASQERLLRKLRTDAEPLWQKLDSEVQAGKNDTGLPPPSFEDGMSVYDND